MHKEKIVTIRGREYKLEAVWHDDHRYYTWNAYRKSSEYGSWWEKIPCWTRAEERNFPKLVAAAAALWVNELNQAVAHEVAA